MKVIAAATLAAALLACGAQAQKPAAAPSAILSVATLKQTGTLLKDLFTYGFITAHDALPPAAQETLAKAKTEVTAAYDKHGKKHVEEITKIVSGPVAAGIDAASEKTKGVVVLVDGVIEKFEKQFPASKGLIPDATSDRLVTLVYLYTVLSWGFWIIKKILGFFCFFLCCCGMCKKRSDGGKKKKGESAAAKPKPKPKAKK